MPKAVFIAPSSRPGGRRRFHLTATCGHLTDGVVLAVMEKGRFGARNAGYVPCTWCLWREVRGKRPVCRNAGPPRRVERSDRRGPVRCSLMAPHDGDHYCSGGPGKEVYRWST